MKKEKNKITKKNLFILVILWVIVSLAGYKAAFDFAYNRTILKYQEQIMYKEN